MHYNPLEFQITFCIQSLKALAWRSYPIKFSLDSKGLATFFNRFLPVGK